MKKLNVPFVLVLIISYLISNSNLAAQIKVDFSEYNQKNEISVKKSGSDLLRTEWKTSDGGRCALTFNLKDKIALIKSIEADSDQKGSWSIIASNIGPRFDVTIGTRDPAKPWPYIFFDKVDLRPFKTFVSDLSINSVKIISDGPSRTSIVISKISAGSFNGELVFTFYSGSPFILIEAAMKANEAGGAYIFDGMLSGTFPSIVYKNNETDKFVIESPAPGLNAKKVRNRTIMAKSEKGTLAVFPAPHAFIYPLDFSNNYGFVQAGNENGKDLIGTKSQPNGDNRYRPWIDMPIGKIQHMGFFLLLSTKDAENTLERVKLYTHGDTYKEILGYITFANHFHEAISMTDNTNNPSGPKFRDAMMALNVKTVEIAEFHGDGNPADTGLMRLDQLKKMYEVCSKYSVPGSFTMIPGEEANAFFSGHTMYFFPKQVYLTLRKGLSQPYKETIPGYGEVYHAGSEIDMYNIYRDNGGLVWSSHPRIKGSENTPDLFVDHPTFQDDNVFSGGDWKAMPLNLSEDRLGVRPLKLLDDMNQMGFRKRILGEVDPFKIDLSHELYAHMNINYVKVTTVPPATDWSPVFNAIKNLEYFTTTGEVLIHSWSVAPSKDKITADLEWTFPMAFAEVTWGDGDNIKTKTFPLKETKELVGNVQHFEWSVDLINAKWVRFEAWDIARNGAFTQTTWLRPPTRSLTPIVYNFTLINGDNSSPIPRYDPIQEGDTINLALLSTRNLYFRANCNLMATINVSFGFNENVNYATIRNYPYSIPVVLNKGQYKITGSPSIGNVNGKTRILNFSVIDK